MIAFGILVFLGSMLLGVLVADRMDGFLADIWAGLKNALALIGRIVIRPRRLVDRPYFDTSAARRESYALGLPFPESDGTLSFAPEPARRRTDAEVHAEIHARRAVAQFGITGEEAGKALREAFIPKLITSHMPDDQQEAWAAMVRERGWTCSTHASCELNTPSCRLINPPSAEAIADAVVREVERRNPLTQGDVQQHPF